MTREIWCPTLEETPTFIDFLTALLFYYPISLLSYYPIILLSYYFIILLFCNMISFLAKDNNSSFII